MLGSGNGTGLLVSGGGGSVRRATISYFTRYGVDPQRGSINSVDLSVVRQAYTTLTGAGVRVGPASERPFVDTFVIDDVGFCGLRIETGTFFFPRFGIISRTQRGVCAHRTVFQPGVFTLLSAIWRGVSLCGRSTELRFARHKVTHLYARVYFGAVLLRRRCRHHDR